MIISFHSKKKYIYIFISDTAVGAGNNCQKVKSQTENVENHIISLICSI